MVWLSLGHALAGTSVPLPNHSFENQSNNFVNINIKSWQKAPKPDWYDESGGNLWVQLAGAFKNTAPGSADHIDNCDGDQAIWIFAVPEVALFQDYESIGGTNSVPDHEFDANYKVGASYSLTVAVLGGGGGMPEGATLEIGLYFRDGSSNRVIISATSITNTAVLFPNNTHFLDFGVQIPIIKSGDPWAGRHIGVQLLSTVTTSLQGGYWDLDNVRLEEIPPPTFSLTVSTTTASEMRISWPSVTGYQYQVKASADLLSWSDFEAPLPGTGSELSKSIQLSGPPNSYFTVVATTVP
jgi:hypothetical protein